MRTRRHGDIVNISSLGGLVAFAATGYYHANKFDCPFSRKTITKTCARVGMEKKSRSVDRAGQPTAE
jgi:NADP-dependent 3-hydroxy acid dehydrogenase YdfG